MTFQPILLQRAIIIPEELAKYVHVPEPPGGTSEAPITICGWTGNHEIVGNAAITCPDCLRVVHYCQQLSQVVALT